MTNFKPNQTAQSALFLKVSPENLREAAARLETTALECPISHSVTLPLCEGVVLLYEPPRGVSERYRGIPASVGDNPDDLS